MKLIAEFLSAIICRKMRPDFQRFTHSFALNGLLALCFVVAFCAETSAAQKKKSKGKPATTRSAQIKNSAAMRTKKTSEPELQLEPLPTDPAVENADISITAHVRARSLEFETVPNPTVEFPGQPARDTVWEAQRENLPTPVEPGVTYRNIGIRLKITSVFRDIDRIVAEALGEVPVTDDASPSTVPVQPRNQSSANKSVTTSQATSPAPPNSLTPSARPPLKERP